jgi:hypothetical protein
MLLAAGTISALSACGGSGNSKPSAAQEAHATKGIRCKKTKTSSADATKVAFAVWREIQRVLPSVELKPAEITAMVKEACASAKDNEPAFPPAMDIAGQKAGLEVQQVKELGG